MRERGLLRRTLLVGMGSLGASVLVPCVPARADDKPLPTPIPGEPHGANDDAARPPHAVLFEEDRSDPNGRQFTGTAVWSAARASADGPEWSAGEMVLHAKVAIPDRGMTVEWAMQRSVEKLIWASHTVHVIFDLAPDSPHGGIQNVPGMLMKPNQYARGVPIIGTAVKVKRGYFLLGLSAVDAERQRNLTLLKEQAWLDVPIVYTDGQRAILAIEKGPSGERAFAQAFAAWDGGAGPQERR
jgi:hypothetical protein